MRALKRLVASLPLFFLFLYGANALAQKTAEKTEKENIEFDAVKDLLKKDMLDVEVAKKKQAEKRKKAIEKKLETRRYDYPSEEDFWPFITEYFLVKNAPQLKWDFAKPDYGIATYLQDVLERVGFVKRKVKLLVVNTKELFHMGLPGRDNESILLISLPFMRALDLSKSEISLILLEDFVRLEEKFFLQKISDKKLVSLLGTSFHKKKPNMDLIEKTHKKYYKHVFDQGFTFEEQFKTTKKMNRLLSGNDELLEIYKKALAKIDLLVKNDKAFKNYLKIYPSPEMQLEWLKPGKE